MEVNAAQWAHAAWKKLYFFTYDLHIKAVDSSSSFGGGKVVFRRTRPQMGA